MNGVGACLPVRQAQGPEPVEGLVEGRRRFLSRHPPSPSLPPPPCLWLTGRRTGSRTPVRRSFQRRRSSLLQFPGNSACVVAAFVEAGPGSTTTATEPTKICSPSGAKRVFPCGAAWPPAKRVGDNALHQRHSTTQDSAERSAGNALPCYRRMPRCSRLTGFAASSAAWSRSSNNAEKMYGK
jgi:hypothetical protein